jgi:DnaJ-class molecular chaperone
MSNETCAECHGTGSARHDPDRPRHTCPDCNGQGEVGDGKENHALFGRLVWNMIQRKGDDFCGDEWSEEILPLAEVSGL